VKLPEAAIKEKETKNQTNKGRNNNRRDIWRRNKN
jgi:hypothetical protein